MIKEINMTDKIKASIDVELQKISAPTGVIYYNSSSELVRIQTEELSNDTLDRLAATWLDELYSKAGKENPFKLERG
jgi:hypothetical protein